MLYLMGDCWYAIHCCGCIRQNHIQNSWRSIPNLVNFIGKRDNVTLIIEVPVVSMLVPATAVWVYLSVTATTGLLSEEVQVDRGRNMM